MLDLSSGFDMAVINFYLLTFKIPQTVAMVTFGIRKPLINEVIVVIILASSLVAFEIGFEQ